jgi:hypothetical protein
MQPSRSVSAISLCIVGRSMHRDESCNGGWVVCWCVMAAALLRSWVWSFHRCSGLVRGTAATRSQPVLLSLPVAGHHALSAVSQSDGVMQHTETGFCGATHQVRRFASQQQRSLVMASMSHSSITVSDRFMWTGQVLLNHLLTHGGNPWRTHAAGRFCHGRPAALAAWLCTLCISGPQRLSLCNVSNVLLPQAPNSALLSFCSCQAIKCSDSLHSMPAWLDSNMDVLTSTCLR